MLVALLVLVTSALMLTYMAYWWVSEADSYSCNLAAGVDFDHMSDLELLVTRTSQSVAYTNCQLRYAQPAPWWVPASWLALLAVAAVALFFWLPVWKARRGRVVALASVDHDRGIQTVLEEVVAVAGLARVPRVVVDPAASSVGAVLFGRNGRPVLCLHGGLLALKSRDAAGFRAVLLHEFAHVRNGDITLVYATVALWRVFLFLVAPPYLVGVVMYLVGQVRSGGSLWAVPSRSILQVLFLVALVYLARSDVLRSREIHADRAAVRWGADSRGWHVPASPTPEGMLRRRLASFAELWRSHPRWELRRGALTDPGPVYAVPALPMFLTGAAAVLINSQLALALQPYSPQMIGALTSQAAALAAAGTVAGVVGITLWRAVIHAVLTGVRPPSGLRAGLWLGTGVGVGTLIMGHGTIEQLFPTRNALLLLFLLGAPAFTWWTAQVAQLWVTVWRGRTLRLALAASLAAGWLALAQWFAWWHGRAAVIGTGWWYETEGMRKRLEQLYPGPAGDHETMLSGISVVFPVVLNTNALPLAAAAVTALWVVPLAAWVPRPASAARPWTHRAVLDIEGAVEPSLQSPPRLRGVLLTGLLCGVGCWVAVVAVVVYPRTGLTGPPVQGTNLQGLLFLTWMYIALTVSAVTAGAIAAARARRYRLLMTLIAAQVAALVGTIGVVVLLLFDGCVGGLSVFSSSCVRRPAWLRDWLDLHIVLDFALMTITVASFAVAAAVSAIRRARASHRLRPVAVVPLRREMPTGRRGLVAVVCVAALAVSAAEAAYRQNRTPQKVADVRAAQEEAQQVSTRLKARVVAPRTKARQVDAWNDLGGEELLARFRRERGRLVEIQRAFVEGKEQPGYLLRLRPVCERFGRTAIDAYAYFRIPDARGQALWQQLILDAAESTLQCRKALDHLSANRLKQAGSTLASSFKKANTAYKNSDAIASRIEEVKRAGGL
ncbi:M56 family metallopeptidase [Streptomyces scopuliridis]|uniref:M56 family metallopeptidase n=1 Tax=Streptomyces scopuliridis TaxID=452529 RepID=UPI0034423427